MPKTTHQELPSPTYYEELLLLIARQMGRVPIPIACSLAAICFMVADSSPWWQWTTWLATAIGISAARWRLAVKLSEETTTPIDKRLRLLVLVTALTGVVHGLSLLFFTHLSDIEKALHTIILLGLCIGSVSTNAGYRPIFLGYLMPILAMLCAAWLAIGMARPDATQSYLIVVLLPLAGVIYFGLARDFSTLFKNSYDIRSEQEALNHRLSAALKEAEQASASKTRFLAAASHDLRQPIHTLTLFSAALELQPLNARSREISTHINLALESLASQLDALLDVSRLDAKLVKVNRSAVSVSLLVDRICADLDPLFTEAGLTFKRDLAAEQWVDTDESLLERILRNVLSNAIKYTDHGEVLLTTRRNRDELEIVIADTGIGIADDELEHIFEEFYQVGNEARDRAKGLGLGLAIVKRLCDLLGIDLFLESALGEGTRITLTLPLSAKGAAGPSKEAVQNLETGLTLLVVDDEEGVREGMRVLLESQSYSVKLASNSVEALQLISAENIDVMLVDYRLGRAETGLDLIRSARLQQENLPAVLISGDTAPTCMQEAAAAGIPLLHKPVSMQTLQATLAGFTPGMGE